MTLIDWLTVLAVAICLIISAFYSASETALTASSRAAMARLEKQGNRDASIVNRLMATRERLLGAILFANNFTNIAASTLMTGLMLDVLRQDRRDLRDFGDDRSDFRRRRSDAEDRCLQCAGSHGARRRRAGRNTVRLFWPILRVVEWLVRIMLRGLGMPLGKHSVDPVAARGIARHGRSDASRRRGGEARPRHDGRLARSARPGRLRRDGPSHQDGHARCRRAAARDCRGGAGERRHPPAAVARLAG